MRVLAYFTGVSLGVKMWGPIVTGVDAPALIPTMTAQFLLNSLYHWNEFARYYVFFGQYVYLL